MYNDRFKDWCRRSGANSVEEVDQYGIVCEFNDRTVEYFGHNGVQVLEDGELIGGGDLEGTARGEITVSNDIDGKKTFRL